MKIELFDSTLRDGAQGEGISFSVSDKLKVLRVLDLFGVDFIEAGNPGSNPKDLEFFRQAGGLKNAKLVAFGSTKRKYIKPEEDDNLNALLLADTEYVSIFGKSWDLHVDCILNATLEENLDMISQTISYLTAKGKKVLFDAEHFFDGYKSNADYALETLLAAQKAGAVRAVLCETNGGTMPHEVFEIVNKVKQRLSIPLGIHTHNDSGCAVANSMEAVRAGATQVQGTFIGIGERTGNANLSTVIANLETKCGYETVGSEKLKLLKDTASYISEVANLALPNHMPYVGSSAFAHKGGMHVDGVLKNPRTFEHIDPTLVGNERNILLSEVSGRGTLISKITEIAPHIEKGDPIVKELTERIKQLEYDGYQFEAADASFELMVLKAIGSFHSYFDIADFKIISSQDTTDYEQAGAMIKVKVGERYEITADEGDGPVNAIDKALRKALEVFYPALSRVRLTDYKVRVVNTGASTAAITRVLIESTDGKHTWTTVGASKDIINASMIALVDSLEYMLYNNKEYNYNKKAEEN